MAKRKAPSNHLVMRCPTCRHSLWPRQISQLLGFRKTKAVWTDDVGFVAITGNGRGWKIGQRLPKFADVDRFDAGAAKQLRALCKAAVRQMYLSGLITIDDLAKIAGLESVSTKKGITVEDAEPKSSVSAPEAAVVPPQAPVAPPPPPPPPYVVPPPPAPPWQRDAFALRGVPVVDKPLQQAPTPAPQREEVVQVKRGITVSDR